MHLLLKAFCKGILWSVCSASEGKTSPSHLKGMNSKTNWKKKYISYSIFFSKQIINPRVRDRMEFSCHKEVQSHCLLWVSICVRPRGIWRWSCGQAWPQLPIQRPWEGRRACCPSWTSIHLLPKDGNEPFAPVHKFCFVTWQQFWLINVCPLSAPEGFDSVAKKWLVSAWICAT